MSSAVTTQGQTRINQLRGAEEPLVIDRMVLALIPGLDPTLAVDRNQQMPDPAHIVHTHTIEADHKGYVTPDQVVYSIILGSDVGNFSFNWIGTLEKDTDTVITVTTTPETPKRKTDLATNTTGNNITRNVMMAFQDAQNLTGITVSAQTWQFDFTAQIDIHSKEIVDPTKTGTQGKHVTDSQAKGWEDHIKKGMNDAPHGLAVLSAPIFPEILTAGSRLAMTDNGNGTIAINSGQLWIHRGLVEYNTSSYSTAERTFTHAANKTYHLRWSPSGGFALKDLADNSYNPVSLPETDESFDTDYDDMLIARVDTDGANVPEITALLNKAILKMSGSSTKELATSANGGVANVFYYTLNYARKPNVIGGGGFSYVHSTASADRLYSTTYSVSRYKYGHVVRYDATPDTIISGTLYSNIMAIA